MVCILSSVRFTDRCQFEKDTKKGKNDGGRSFFFSARRESEIDIERERERGFPWDVALLCIRLICREFKAALSAISRLETRTLYRYDSFYGEIGAVRRRFAFHSDLALKERERRREIG